jgi:putative DNA primase/helicase
MTIIEGQLPAEKNGEPIKDPNDLYLAGGGAEDFVLHHIPKINKPFRLDKKGVWLISDEKEKDDLLICTPLEVVADTRDNQNNSWGVLLRWQDKDGNAHDWAMPKSLLSGTGEEIRKQLLDGGLPFIATSSKGRAALIDYIQRWPVNKKMLCVDKTGWHGGVYVLPGRTIGEDQKQEVRYQSSINAQGQYAQQGTTHHWQDKIARYAAGNSRFMFAISTAFAAPLLELMSIDGGGFNLRGTSSTGKTTALLVAASVCGGKEYTRTWRATSNGLEGTATAHNDALLCLDEMGQCDPKQTGEIAYMLPNGQSKQRANKLGDGRDTKRWRLLFLSSGELSLADQLATGNIKSKAGQEVRLVDIPMDTGKHGGFEVLHGFKSGAELSDYLRQETCTTYGQPYIDYLEWLTANRKEAQDITRQVIADCECWTPDNVDGQVKRVNKRFGIVAAGGVLASKAGVTGWSKPEVIEAAKICFNAWLGDWGGVGSREDQQAFDQVVSMLQKHGSSRFGKHGVAGDDEKVINRLGYTTEIQKHGDCFLVFQQQFKAEICKGFNYKAVLGVLEAKGYLVREGDHKTIARNGARYYAIKCDIISEEN